MTISEPTAAAPRPASPFPVATGRARGYDRAAVDAFLARARASFEGDSDAPPLQAGDVREAAFPLVRRGYVVESVDAALARIEDAFAERERAHALGRVGAGVWVEQTREAAQTILDRLTRPKGHRFARTGIMRYGYRVDEVDLVTDRIARFLSAGDSVTVEQVRSVAFRMQRGGYSEVQVDAVLDAVVEVMLAVG
ncbi:DivIVA domain-containing protein [Microbacterium sp. X-17]|uniref:DivIVA domain-containing protein n=1 Tax=Microbacterium sp. X-17 TaxID=3144404 RepID=UPI0031F48CBB